MLQKHSIFFLLCFLCGCSSPTLVMTYNSDPSGATLYQGNRTYKYTPVNLYYTITSESLERGYMILPPAFVRWVSGATASTNSIRVDLSKGMQQDFTFVRPRNAKGKEIDTQFFLELRRQKIMQDQANAQERANTGRAIYYAMQQHQMQAEHREEMQQLKNLQYLQMMQQNRSYRCVTRQRGSELITECH